MNIKDIIPTNAIPNEADEFQADPKKYIFGAIVIGGVGIAIKALNEKLKEEFLD